MPHDRLFIPLTPNVRSQKAWRVLRVGFLFGVGALIGILASQTLRFAEQIRVSGYPDEITTVHLYKTPRTLAFFSHEQGSATVFPSVPLSIRELLVTSDRGVWLIVYNNDIVGYVTDGAVREPTVTAFGYTVTASEGYTIVSAPAFQPKLERSFRPRYLLRTRIDGEVVQSGVEKSLPLRMSDSAVILKGISLLEKASSTLTLPKNAEPLAAFTADAALLSFMHAFEVPLVYAESSAMIAHIANNGLSAVIGHDDAGITLHFTTAADSISSTQAAAFAKEFVELADIAHDSDSEELYLRPKTPSVVAVTAEKDLSFITATGERALMSIALSSDTLAANNRLLEAGNIGAIEQRLCGITTSSYLRPSAFRQLALPTGKLEMVTVADLLTRAEAIVSKSSTTTICFSEENRE